MSHTQPINLVLFFLKLIYKAKYKTKHKVVATCEEGTWVGPSC